MADRNTAMPSHLRFRRWRILPFVIGILLLFFCGGCARPTTGFMRVGEKKYPTKPKEYEIVVFAEGETPQREYKVIGMVYTSLERNFSSVNRERIIDRLKQKAKKHGADGIMNVRIIESSDHENQALFTIFGYGAERPDHISGEAKAIVFK